jgi:hypothetical protein
MSQALNNTLPLALMPALGKKARLIRDAAIVTLR